MNAGWLAGFASRSMGERLLMPRLVTVALLGPLMVLILGGSAGAEEITVFYDYVENGRLTGGRVVLDTQSEIYCSQFDDSTAAATGWQVTTIIDNGPSENRIDVVILGDGYTLAELDDYGLHVDNVVGLFFDEEPLAAYAHHFNVHRVDVISNESGVDEPDEGIYRDTALDMTYNCDGIPRLLCISVPKARAAASAAPDADQILALANSTRYGGAGYPEEDICTLAGNNASAVEIALHEFGHAFADLADEYHYYDGAVYMGPEPREANVSIYEEPEQIAGQRKWYRWMDLPHVSTFEGAYYHQYGIFRPTSSSKMRSLGYPFEEINVEQFIIKIYQTVSPIDGGTPLSADPLPPATPLFVDVLNPIDHVVDIQWYVDGEAVPGAVNDAFELDYPALAAGVHECRVEVVDNTERVRDEGARQTWLTDSRQWLVEVRKGDCDGDGIVSLEESANFESCLSGPGGEPPEPACGCVDFELDGDVDLEDFAGFQRDMNVD